MKITIRKMHAYKFIAVLTYILLVIAGVFTLPDEYRKTYLYYMLVITVGLALVFLAEQQEDNKGTVIFILGMLALASVYSFRGEMGADDATYQYAYIKANRMNLEEYLKSGKIESGYLILMFFINRLTDGNYYLAQVIISALTFAFWGSAIWDRKDRISVSTASFLFVADYYFIIMGAGLFRIFLAAGIVFWGYRFILNNQNGKYIGTILLASCFHISALFMVFLAFLKWHGNYFYRHWKGFIMLETAAIPAMLFVIVRLIVPFLSSRYQGYQATGSLMVANLLPYVPVFVIGAFMSQYYTTESEKTFYRFCMILIYTTAILDVSCSVFRIGRLVYYTQGGIMLLLASIEKEHIRFGTATELIPLASVFYGMMSLFHRVLWNTYYAGYLFPYHSFFE